MNYLLNQKLHKRVNCFFYLTLIVFLLIRSFGKYIDLNIHLAAALTWVLIILAITIIVLFIYLFIYRLLKFGFLDGIKKKWFKYLCFIGGFFNRFFC